MKNKLHTALRRAALSALALLCSAALFFGAGCASGGVERTQIQISDAQPAAYAEEQKELGVSVICTAVERAVSNQYGSVLSAAHRARIRAAVSSFASSCEARGVPERDYLAAADIVAGQGALFTALVSEGFTERTFSALAELFGSLCGLFGADVSGRLTYDVALSLCEYNAQKYEERYADTGLSYYLGYAEDWRARRASLAEEVGEDNFSCIVRMAFSAAGVGAAASASALSDGEIALFLRAEGDLLSRAELSASGWQVLSETYAALFENSFAATLQKSGELQNFAPCLQPLAQAFAGALQSASSACAAHVRQGDAGGVLYELFGAWSGAQWSALDDFLGVSVSGDTYAAYFAARGLSADYQAYASRMQTGTLQQVRATSKQEFLPALQAYCNAKSPQLAFLIFGL